MNRAHYLLLTALVLLMGGMLPPLQAAASPALSELESNVRNNPDSASAWDELGMAYAREHHFADAMEALNRALQLLPQGKHIRYHIALTTAWSGNYNEAARRYSELLKQYPDDHAIRIDYGQTLAWNRQFKEARQQYQTVLTQDPDHIEALRHLGILTAWESDYADALRVLQKAQQLDPNNVRVLTAQAEVLSWMGNLSAAARTYEQALGFASKDSALRVKLAQTYHQQGRIRAAQDQYLTAISADPSNLEAYLGLSNCYRDNRQFTEAENLLRRAALLFPDESRISESLTEIAAQKSWQFSDLTHLLEPVVFIALLMFMFYHIRRYRRVLQRRNRWMRGLINVGMPLLALVTATMYSFSIWGGEYYRELQTVSQILEIVNLLVLISVFVTLVWLLRFGRNVSHQVILAIGAHPDDIEFGCGATLLRYRESGCQTYGLVLTAGREGYTSGKESETRVNEARASAKTLALSELEILDFPDTQLSSYQQKIKNAVEKMVNRIKPDIVFTHTPHDLHSDHKAVFEATREAVRGACTILCYENPNTPVDFQPAYYVDVADFIDDKIAALGQHKTQAGKSYAAPDVVRSSAGFRGTQARIQYAEAFEVVRVLEKVY